MVAPIGNKFWEARSSHGRKPKFRKKEDLWNSCCEYFDWNFENPLQESIVYQGLLNETQSKPLMRAMTISGLCIFLDIERETWAAYRTRKGFSVVTNKVDEIIRTQKFEGASAGLLNANIIARELGLSEKQDLNHGGQTDNPLTMLLSSIDGEETGLPDGNS